LTQASPPPTPAGALAYCEKMDYDRGIADYNETIGIDPNLAAVYNNRAWTYFKAGKAAQGLPDAKRSLQLRPDHP
jgi:tetratricopeptide (TPR) repeat protein